MRRTILGFTAAVAALPTLTAFATRVADDAHTLRVADSLAAVAPAVADSLTADTMMPDTVPPDTAINALAIIKTDSLTPRRSRIVRTRVDLENPVQFSSSDSMVIVRRDSAFMYGNGSVTYGEIKLDAAQIEMDLGDNTVYAIGRPDSLGELQGTPVFNESGTDYEAKTMRYNFKTSKGIISNVVTQQGEGYLTDRKSVV